MNSMLSPFLVINIIPAILLMHPNISFSYLCISPRLGVSVQQILTPLTKDYLSCIKNVDTDLVVKILF